MPRGNIKDIFSLSIRQKRRRINDYIRESSVSVRKNSNANDTEATENENYVHSEIIYSKVASEIEISSRNPALELEGNTLETSTQKTTFVYNLQDDEPHNKSNDPNEKSEIENFKNLLANWAVNFNISQSALNSLLRILKSSKGLSDLPLDARTLMQTPRNITSHILDVNGGKFIHFGLLENLKCCLMKSRAVPSVIKLNINIDGLPLTKSSASQFWPILGSIVNLNNTKPFVISLFHGLSKPICSNQFIKPFIDEFKELSSHGFELDNKHIKVMFNALICDSPARAFVTGVKGHNAYFACPKCQQEGEFIDNRMTFPELSNTLRTDESFRNRLQPEHHKFKSYLEDLNIDLVSQVAIDPMHLVYLGVVKRLCQFWVNGKKDVCLRVDQLEKVSSHLILLRSCIPEEFARKPRKILDIGHWKATELRQFLLYTGPIVLKDVLPQDRYDHFLTLSTAVRILSDAETYLKLNDYAHSLLQWFVKNYAILYGEQYISFNVHALLHLSKDAVKLGPIDSYSAFEFENFMQLIKKKIKLSQNPLQQFCNRITEEHNLDSSCDVHNYPTYKLERGSNKIKKIIFSAFALSVGDCFQTQNNCIYEVIDILGNTENVFFKSKKCTNAESFYNYPLESKILGIFKSAYIRGNDSHHNIELIDVKRKCLKFVMDALSSEEGFIIVPLIQSNNCKI